MVIWKTSHGTRSLWCTRCKNDKFVVVSAPVDSKRHTLSSSRLRQLALCPCGDVKVTHYGASLS